MATATIAHAPIGASPVRSIAKKTVRYLAWVALLAVAAYLGLWPVPIRPVAWEAPLSPGYTGPSAPLAYANNLREFLKVSGSPIKVSTVNPTFIKTSIVEKLNPIYLEPVDPNGNSQNPYLQAVLDAGRQLVAAGLPASFVGQTYTQLLQMNDPLPNVVTGSRVEPYATQSLSLKIEQAYLADNALAAIPFGAAGGGKP